MPALGGKQQPVLSFAQQTLKMEQRGRLQNDGRTENARSAHEKSAQAGDDTVPSMEVRRTLAAPIEDQELMPNQGGFGHDGAKAARLCQSRQRDEHMNA